MLKKSRSFGPRVGKKLRDRFDLAAPERSYDCPACLKRTLRREAAGIWVCTKCGNKMAGKAYRPG